MTVWRPKDRRTYRYRFYVDGQLYEGNTKQITEPDAQEWEAEEQRRVRRRLAGLPVLSEHSPRISDFAAVYLKRLARQHRVRRLDRVRELLRVALRFWGPQPSGSDPKTQPIEGEPYHHLRLLDPIRDSDWLLKYERWLEARRVLVSRKTGATRPLSAQTKNHYLSIMSRLYDTAMRPEYVKTTGVAVNPFKTMERHRKRGRRRGVTADELRRWLQHTPRHAQLAIAIAALAPKLRLRNVLELRWDTSVDQDLTYITVEEHKTVHLTEEPLVVPISTALRALLAVARRSKSHGPVVTYRGKAGVTFHTIRHTAATLLAELPGLTEAQPVKSIRGSVRAGAEAAGLTYGLLRRGRSATMGQDILTTADLHRTCVRRASARCSHASPDGESLDSINKIPRRAWVNATP